jgi:tetratricopeptide (TPR) repeat protein
MKRWIPLLYLALIGLAHAQHSPTPADLYAVTDSCGALHNPAYGPWDYRKAANDQKDLVERAHFTPDVENLRARKTGPFGGDIGYTLRAFPNHPRALLAMQRLTEKEKKPQPEGSPYTIECFYARALRFQPDDYVVRLLFSAFLVGRNDFAAAVPHLEYVAGTQADNPLTLQNIGLIYFDMKNYEQALAYAHKALKLGLKSGPLRTRLQMAGKWADPAPDAPSAPDESASSGAR